MSRPWPLAAFTWPGITSVDQRLKEQGAQAAQAPLELIDGAEPGTRQLTPWALAACLAHPTGSRNPGSLLP